MSRSGAADPTRRYARTAAHYVAPALVLSVGSLLSVFLFGAIRSVEVSASISEFNLLSNDHMVAIEREIDANLAVILSVGSLYDASETVEREEFRHFVESPLTHHQSIQALEWIPRVPHAQRQAFVDAPRREGYSDFDIRERNERGEMEPAAPRDEYFPVYFVEPYVGNEAALGFDLGSNRTRLAAINASRDSGQPLSTARIVLVQETEQQAYGFLIFMPIYEEGMPLETVELRRAHLAGFALGVYRINDIVDSALSHLDSRDIGVQLHDAADGSTLYSAPALGDAYPYRPGTDPVTGSGLASQRHVSTIDVAGRPWQGVCLPTAQYLAGARIWRQWAGLGAGLLFTVLISTYFVLHARWGARVTQLVDDRTQDLQESNRRLGESEEEVRAIVETVVDGLITIDADGIIRSYNPAAAAIFGYRSDEAIGQDVRMLMPPPDHDGHDEHIAAYLGGGERDIMGTSREVIGVRKNGSLCPMDLAVSGMRLGGSQMFTGVVRDITEQKRAEDALRTSEERYRELFENASDLIQSVDSDGRFRYVNAAWLRKLGYTEDEVAGLTAFGIVAPDSTAHWAETFLNVMGGKDAGQVEVDFLTKDGGVITVAGDMNCRFENGRPVEIRAMFRDVTEQRRLAQLKDEFISTVSHELRTPLTSIQGSLGLMSMGGAGELTDQAKELLRIAYSNGDRLVRLINNILDIEKMESGKMEFRLDPIDINGLIRQTIEENQPYGAQHNVQYTFDDPGGAVIVNADVDRLTQVMANLLSNAAKFSPENDTVSIHVAERPGWIRVSVKDNGPGIPDSARNLVFEKFSQVDSSSTRQQGGTGLGLSICRAIINRHDGAIDFESEVGVGTTFYFDLPRPAAPPVVRPADGVGAKGRVLIVEDDRDVARLLGIMLGRAGYDADVVHSAEQAREALQSARYAALTLDLRLPGTPGLELLRQVKEDEDTRDLPVIVISAFVDDGKQELNGSAVQVVDWIPKPIDEDRLIAALESAVAPRSSHRARVLHIEDDADLASATAAILRDVADVTKAASLQAARQAIREETFDLVILDVGLPDGSGLDLLGDLGATPVVVFSAAEMGEEVNTQVAAALLKARTPPEQLVSTIQAILAHRA